MRKIFTVILLLTLCLAFVSCLTNTKDSGTKHETTGKAQTEKSLSLAYQPVIHANALSGHQTLANHGTEALDTAPEPEPVLTAVQIAESDINVRYTAVLIFKESGACTEEHQLLVGKVLMNRLADPRFPDTLYDIITAPKQYDPYYTEYQAWLDIPEDYREYYANLALRVMDGEPFDAPDNIVWQAEFPQGTGTYKTFDTNIGGHKTTTYICY